VALVNRVVANLLALEMVRDRENLKTVLLEDCFSVGDLRVVGRSTVRIQMVAPAADLKPVEPHWPARRHTSSNGRSAHWPVNKVMGR